MGADAVGAAGGLGVFGEGGVLTQKLAVAGRIAVGVAGEVDVTHAVRTHQIEHLIGAAYAAGPAAGLVLLFGSGRGVGAEAVK